MYKRVNEGENEIKMNVTVKGGQPKPQVSYTIQQFSANYQNYKEAFTFNFLLVD